MDFFDQRHPRRPSRYPALAEYEDGPPPYDEYAPSDTYGPADEGGTGSGRGYGQGGGRGSGLLAGAVTGLLGIAVATGVANFTAAFVRPQASPIVAVGGAFIDRAAPALTHATAGKTGGNDKDLLLLGLWVALGLIAAAIGMLAGRRVGAGLAGTGLLGGLEAYIAISRPGGRGPDAIPSILGAIAGIAVIAGLVRAGTRPDDDEMTADEAGYEPAAHDSPPYKAASYEPSDYESPPDYEFADYESAHYEPAGYELPADEARPYPTAPYEAPMCAAAPYEAPGYATSAFGTLAHRTGRPA